MLLCLCYSPKKLVAVRFLFHSLERRVASHLLSYTLRSLCLLYTTCSASFVSPGPHWTLLSVALLGNHQQSVAKYTLLGSLKTFDDFCFLYCLQIRLYPIYWLHSFDYPYLLWCACIYASLKQLLFTGSFDFAFINTLHLRKKRDKTVSNFGSMSDAHILNNAICFSLLQLSF